jgi:hypothetical protein
VDRDEYKGGDRSSSLGGYLAKSIGFGGIALIVGMLFWVIVRWQRDGSDRGSYAIGALSVVVGACLIYWVVSISLGLRLAATAAVIREKTSENGLVLSARVSSELQATISTSALSGGGSGVGSAASAHPFLHIHAEGLDVWAGISAPRLIAHHPRSHIHGVEVAQRGDLGIMRTAIVVWIGSEDERIPLLFSVNEFTFAGIRVISRSSARRVVARICDELAI